MRASDEPKLVSRAEAPTPSRPARGTIPGSLNCLLPACRRGFRVPDLVRATPGSRNRLRLVVLRASDVPKLVSCAEVPTSSRPARGAISGSWNRALPACRSGFRVPNLGRATSGSRNRLRLVVLRASDEPRLVSRAEAPTPSRPARGTIPGSWNRALPACRSGFRVPNLGRATSGSQNRPRLVTPADSDVPERFPRARMPPTRPSARGATSGSRKHVTPSRRSLFRVRRGESIVISGSRDRLRLAGARASGVPERVPRAQAGAPRPPARGIASGSWNRVPPACRSLVRAPEHRRCRPVVDRRPRLPRTVRL
ncbi:hypothetical protein EDF35_0163 [Rathayibacter sp. PhB151]|nr:hypothetical protein EDF35_0163 [Rathayibacter sp. PhB151]